MSKKRDIFQTFEAFPGDELSFEECKALRKKAKFRDPALISQEEVDDMKRGLTDSIRRPMNLSAVQSLRNNSKNNTKIKFSDSVNETLLFTQIEAVRGKRTFIMHNFDKDSPNYIRLYTWPVFNDISEAIMRPIYYLIQQRIRPRIAPLLSATIVDMTLVANDIQKRHNLQHQIANGTMICINLVNGIEDTMGSMLVRMIVSESRLAFIFEWYEEPLFLFFIAFDAPECGVEQHKDGHIMILHRSDLFVAHEVEDDGNDDERDTNFMEGRESNENDTGIMTRSKPETSFIAFYGEKIELSVIETLKACKMTFLSYGYIKKEDQNF